MRESLKLHEKDFYAWTLEQASLIKNKTFDKIDTVNLLEEVENMGASEVRELESRFEVLLMHLLKWKYQPTHRTMSWELTIKEQRKRIEKRLQRMPSLKSRLNEVFLDSYEVAIYEAAKETNLSLKAFPDTCEWVIKQVMDYEFFPN